VEVRPIGFVACSRERAEDDYWGGAQACITLTDAFTPSALEGLASFSHVEVLYLFHALDASQVVTGARHPRNNPEWPLVGIFAQRGRNRPNRIGSTMCRIVRVEAVQLFVAELDAINGTPVLDLKPVLREFLPRGPLRQPRWSHELMRAYWAAKA
jgi:tRNA (adenine37-N6)-methyltransferase